MTAATQRQSPCAFGERTRALLLWCSGLGVTLIAANLGLASMGPGLARKEAEAAIRSRYHVEAGEFSRVKQDADEARRAVQAIEVRLERIEGSLLRIEDRLK